MKSVVIDTDRIKLEGRQSMHRRKMSKNSTLINGADESDDAEDERQVNLAAAYHDHISCTKSADPSKEARATLPCETDHIYANCSEIRNKNNNINSPSTLKERELLRENKKLRKILFVQLDLIRQLQDQLAQNIETIKNQTQESETLRAQLERRERRMCLLRKRYNKSDDESVDNLSEIESAESHTNELGSAVTSCSEHSALPSSVNLVTRYFGRRSRTVPSRALKRRYLGPPKTVPTKKSALKPESSSSEGNCEPTSKEEDLNASKLSATRVKSSDVDIKKTHKKHAARSKRIIRNHDYLTTDKAYFLPDTQCSSNSLVCSETLIDVPSWKYKPVSSFYQMEGTENINDPVFHRRHQKCEQDERRRKRWDIQRLREQKASEKLKYKQSREGKDSENHHQRKSSSFYPDPRHVEYIEVTDHLPVLAFGHLIPLFQPSEFSLSWNCSENVECTDNYANKMKKNRSYVTEPKVT